jgi:plasmid maintenance system antidote protein VapI
MASGFISSFTSCFTSLSKGLALRLARYFGTDAQPWLNRQLSYDLKIA